MGMRQLTFIIGVLAAAGCATVPTDAALEVEDLCEFSREKGPEGLSDITRIGGNRYYCVNDRRGFSTKWRYALRTTGRTGRSPS